MNLNEFLKKVGINSILDLKEEEKEEYRRLEEAFARLERPIAIEDLTLFLEEEMEKIIDELNQKKEDKEIRLLIARLKNYKDLLAFIKIPERSKKRLKKELEIRSQLIK